MKKLICVLMSLMLVFLSVSAFAEEFSIRNGITFGMTVDEVSSLEGVTLHYDDDYVAGTNDIINGYDTYWVNGELAGYSCTFYYLFNQTNDELSSIMYMLYDWCDSKQEHLDFYSEEIAEMDAILTNKYDAVSLGAFEELGSPAFNAIIADADGAAALCDVKVDGKQYLVKYEDCYVTVEHLVCEMIYPNSYPSFLAHPDYSEIKEYIIYTQVDNAIVEPILGNMASRQADIEYSIQNDF